VNDRQLYALTHPLNNASDLSAIARRRSILDRGDRTLLVVVLAVDR
jgi:hypothetical protein